MKVAVQEAVERKGAVVALRSLVFRSSPPPRGRSGSSASRPGSPGRPGSGGRPRRAWRRASPGPPRRPPPRGRKAACVEGDPQVPPQLLGLVVGRELLPHGVGGGHLAHEVRPAVERELLVEPVDRGCPPRRTGSPCEVGAQRPNDAVGSSQVRTALDPTGLGLAPAANMTGAGGGTAACRPGLAAPASLGFQSQGRRFSPSMLFQGRRTRTGARGRTRTDTSLRKSDFKSEASTIPPPGQGAGAISGKRPPEGEPLWRSRVSSRIGFPRARGSVEVFPMMKHNARHRFLALSLALACAVPRAPGTPRAMPRWASSRRRT
jgi:hypothetical protein